MHQPWTSGVPPTPGTEARGGGGGGGGYYGGDGGAVGRFGGGLEMDEISLLPESAAVHAAKAFMSGAVGGGDDGGTPRSARSDVGMTVLLAASKFRDAANKARGGGGGSGGGMTTTPPPPGPGLRRGEEMRDERRGSRDETR